METTQDTKQLQDFFKNMDIPEEKQEEKEQPQEDTTDKWVLHHVR